MKTTTLLNPKSFTYVNENIQKLFKPEPIRGPIEVRSFGKYMSSEEIIAELAKNGCYPANATELFDWAEQHPDEKNKYVVALGSIASFEGSLQVCYVWCGDSGRGADLGWFGGGWVDDDGFAFGRESTQSSDTENLHSVPLNLERAIELVKEAGYQVSKLL